MVWKGKWFETTIASHPHPTPNISTPGRVDNQMEVLSAKSACVVCRLCSWLYLVPSGSPLASPLSTAGKGVVVLLPPEHEGSLADGWKQGLWSSNPGAAPYYQGRWQIPWHLYLSLLLHKLRIVVPHPSHGTLRGLN